MMDRNVFVGEAGASLYQAYTEFLSKYELGSSSQFGINRNVEYVSYMISYIASTGVALPKPYIGKGFIPMFSSPCDKLKAAIANFGMEATRRSYGYCVARVGHIILDPCHSMLGHTYERKNNMTVAEFSKYWAVVADYPQNTPFNAKNVLNYISRMPSFSIAAATASDLESSFSKASRGRKFKRIIV